MGRNKIAALSAQPWERQRDAGAPVTPAQARGMQVEPQQILHRFDQTQQYAQPEEPQAAP